MSHDVRGERSFESLLAHARSGSEEALASLVRRFTPSVYRSIRRSLARSLRRTTDSDDIAQSVWRSFFAMREKHLLMESPARLRGFLCRMAAHKTIDRGRRFFSQQRGAGIPFLSIDDISEAKSAVVPVETKIPSPSEQLIARESLEDLVNSVPERFSAVIRKRAEGATISEISAELGIPLRSLHRILNNARLRASG